MSGTGKVQARRIAGRIRKAWSEMDYAQRRMLEVQSGVPGLTRRNTKGYRSPRVPHHA